MNKSNETIVVDQDATARGIVQQFIYRGPKKNHEVIIVHATTARP